MGNLFANIPVPAANGIGAAVDVSTMGKTKSLVIGGGFQATVNVEYATDDVGAGPWAPLATFLQSGNLTIDVAARWLRAVTSEYKSGAPNLDVGSDDAGAVFALLTADGASVDVSALPLCKTVVGPTALVGNVEISEDGNSWAQIFPFQGQGGGTTRAVAAKFARVVGGYDVWMGAANAGGGGAGGGCPCPPTTEHVSGDGSSPPIPLNQAVDTSFISSSGSESNQDFTLADGTVDGQIHNIVNESVNITGITVTPANLHNGTSIGTGFPDASATLIWNAPMGEWFVLGTMLGFSVS
jgi:hypothetical protein